MRWFARLVDETLQTLFELAFVIASLIMLVAGIGLLSVAAANYAGGVSAIHEASGAMHVLAGMVTCRYAVLLFAWADRRGRSRRRAGD
jgi:hypothetical protein